MATQFPQTPAFEMRCDPIDVTTSYPPSIPDPDWAESDTHGHEHRWLDGHLPTLRVVSEDWGPNGDGDEGTDTYWYCLECGDEVHPRWKPDPNWVGGCRRFIQGPVYYLVDGIEVSREQAIEAWVELGGDRPFPY